MYASGSGADTGKQVPKPLPASAFDSALGSISSSVVMEYANSVVIQGVGNATFKYDCTDAVGTGIAAAGFSAANTILASGSAQLTLPISPCAVSASGNTNITFIYRGGL